MTHERKLGFSEVDERRRKKTRLADFNSLDNLIAHARDELGATHVTVAGTKSKIFFPHIGQHPYEAASVRIKNGYWHADGPGARQGVRSLPTSARPIGRGRQRAAAPRTQVARDYIAVDSRGRTIAGPFKSYGDAKQAAGLGGNVEYVRETGTAGVFEVDEGAGVPGASHGLEWHRYKEGFIGTVDGERRFLLDPTADGDWILWHVDTKSGFQDHKIGRYGTAADAKDAARATPLEPVKEKGPPPPKSQTVGSAPTLTGLEQKVLEQCVEETGAPAGSIAEQLNVPTGTVTRAAKKLQAEGLLEDTGYAMKRDRYGMWQYIDKPKTEGGMVSKPGASTVWRATLRGHGAIGHEPSPYVTWKP